MLAASVAVAAVNVMVAVAVPELVDAAVNVVVPHPSVDGVARDASATEGSTSASVSPAAIAAVEENSKDREVAASVVGFANLRMLVLKEDASSSVDSAIAKAFISEAPARVTASVRVFKLAV
jgi:hypothetical protein